VGNSGAPPPNRRTSHPSHTPHLLMSSSLDTKRAALHDISNKGALPGGDKVR